jgi:HYR domain/NHL repeat
MRLHTPLSRRPTTSSSSSHLLKYLWPVLALALLVAPPIWPSAAAADCNLLLKWGTTGSGDGQFITPRAIATDSAGNVYVADQNDRVQKFDSSGVFQSKFATGGSNAGAVIAASGVAVDSMGNIYVTDSDPDRSSGMVQKFNSSGTFVLAWGTQGGGNGQFQGAGGVAVDSANNVYVVDIGNHRIEKFTSVGGFITQWGGMGAGNGQFNGPQGVAVDPADNIYVADTNNNRIQKFDSTGAFITKWGSNGTGDGQFASPQGVAADGLGNIYVADTNNNRIEKFDSSGTFISACGSAGSGDGEFSGSQDLAADTAGNYYVADTGNDRVQKFGAATASPVANAGPDQILECTGGTTSVLLNGTASTPGSGTISSYTWAEGATTLGTGATLTVSLPTGSHTITLTVMDTGGGSATDDVVINIRDTTGPTINCPGDIMINLLPNSTATAMPVSFTVTASDSCSSNVTVTTDHASGSNFPVGTTTVNAVADDHNGNTSSCSFNVTVLYGFNGFFPPVANPPTVNVVNAGRAIPVKFSLSGNKGLNIFAPGSPASGPIACDASAPAATLQDTVTAGGSSLSYDPTTDQYIYVWKTDAAWAGTCRQLVVQLNDGSIHRANFRFK